MMSLHFITNQRVRAIAFGTVAASPTGLSRLRRLRRVASTIAGAALMLALIFLFVFALPALFGGL